MSGTILAATLVARAASVLFDVNGVNWPAAELLGWLNDGQRQIVMMVPDANNVTVSIQLQAGTRQTIPADGWTLIDVYRNMGVSGTAPGRSIRLVTRKTLDQFTPTWHSQAPVGEVHEFAFDGHDQTKFWVNPPSDGTVKAEVNYSQVPADVALTDPIRINDIYGTILVDYMLYRAGQKKAAYSPGESFAATHWSAFATALGAKTTSEDAADPNIRLAHAPAGGAE